MWVLQNNMASANMEFFTVSSQDGDFSFVLYKFGATLTSWRHNGDEKIFVSENAILDGTKAIRGGIPIVFPQFAQPLAIMPQHGFARTTVWSLHSFYSDSDSATIELVLTETENTKKVWPHNFCLRYLVKISRTGLYCQLSALNTGQETFSCHMLLHTYFRIPQIESVVISGLQSLKYIDKVLQNTLITPSDNESITISSETDRIYLTNNEKTEPYPITLTAANSYSMQILKRSYMEFTQGNQSYDIPGNVVVWNPWAQKSSTMSDLGATQYPHFVCIEPGLVSEWFDVPSNHNLVLIQELKPL